MAPYSQMGALRQTSVLANSQKPFVPKPNYIVVAEARLVRNRVWSHDQKKVLRAQILLAVSMFPQNLVRKENNEPMSQGVYPSICHEPNIGVIQYSCQAATTFSL